VQSVEIALLEASGQHQRALTILREATGRAQNPVLALALLTVVNSFQQVKGRLLDQCAMLCQKIGDSKGELDCLQRLNQ
jgi:hypothetical protein